MKKIKIGDNVKIIQGKEKGQVGKIKTIFYIKKKVVVDGMYVMPKDRVKVIETKQEVVAEMKQNW